MKRAKKEMEETENSTVYKRARKQHVCDKDKRCTFCQEHGGENKSRYGKHGKTKPKYKDKQ